MGSCASFLSSPPEVDLKLEANDNIKNNKCPSNCPSSSTCCIFHFEKETIENNNIS